MSKIEDALKKISGTGTTRGPGSAETARRQQLARAPQANAPGALSKQTSTDMTQRASSRAEISRMEEATPISDEVMAHNKIIHPEMEDGRVLNAFRELRTKIIQKSLNGNGIIMVTGVALGDGASFVARNLAAAFALDTSKTALLLDCNLKNPRYDGINSGGTRLGLTDYLESEDISVDKIIHRPGIDRFRMIPSGVQCEVPAEYFTSVKMGKLLVQLKQRYPERYVILDTPPITESADTSIVADLCDHILLVVPYGKVTEMQVDAAVKAIGHHKLVGVVFNNEPQFPKPRVWKSIWKPMSS